MRSLRPAATGLLALTLTAVGLGACASSTPGWTYAPAPSITPAPSGSAEPSADPSAGPAADITALNLAFDTATLEEPADEPFQIVFANDDPNIPHNIEIKDAAGTSVFTGDIFNGVETRTYDVPALPAGSYQFLCTVHPTMAGTLTAG